MHSPPTGINEIVPFPPTDVLSIVPGLLLTEVKG